MQSVACCATSNEWQDIICSGWTHENGTTGDRRFIAVRGIEAADAIEAPIAQFERRRAFLSKPDPNGSTMSSELVGPPGLEPGTRLL